MISSSDLAGVKSTVNLFLPESCANSRTSEVHPCRVDEAKRQLRRFNRLLPNYLRVPEWDIRLPDGIDIKEGDRLNVTTLSRTYAVLLVRNPQTTSTSTDVEAAFVTLTQDGTLLPFMPNALSGTVTFEKASHSPITADVYLVRAMDATKVYGWEPGRYWCVLFDPALAVDNGWNIRCPLVLGTGAPTTGLKEVFKDPPGGILPLGTAFFVEPA